MNDPIQSMLSSPPGKLVKGQISAVNVATFDDPSKYIPQEDMGPPSQTFQAQPLVQSVPVEISQIEKKNEVNEKRIPDLSHYPENTYAEMIDPKNEEPLELIYQYKGGCPKCHVAVSTTVVKVRQESFALALCPKCHEIQAQRKVKPL